MLARSIKFPAIPYRKHVTNRKYHLFGAVNRLNISGQFPNPLGRFGSKARDMASHRSQNRGDTRDAFKSV